MRNRWTTPLVVILAVVFLAPLVFAASQPAPPKGLPFGGQEPQERQAQSVKAIPAGSEVTVRTDREIAIGTAKPGDIFAATLEDDITQDGRAIIRRGAPVEIRLTKMREDRDELAFQLYTITVAGKKVRVVSDTAREVARKDAPQQQQSLGGALGQAGAAALGGALGGGKGNTLTWGPAQQGAKVPAGTFLQFTLREHAVLK